VLLVAVLPAEALPVLLEEALPVEALPVLQEEALPEEALPVEALPVEALPVLPEVALPAAALPVLPAAALQVEARLPWAVRRRARAVSLPAAEPRGLAWRPGCNWRDRSDPSLAAMSRSSCPGP